MAVAADVPGRFDLVLNGEGYVFANEQERAAYGFTPTFVQRTNIQGDYGDNFQDFWMTLSQNDWSGGVGQKYFRTDEARRRRFWDGANVYALEEGEVTLAPPTDTLTLPAVMTVAGRGRNDAWFASSTNLYHTSAYTDLGAHGLGTGPSTLAFDGVNMFLSSYAASGVRKWDGSAFSTFSTTSAQHLLFLNNTLYGLREGAGTLVRYDTAGTATVLHTWQEADGTAITSGFVGMAAWGGKIVIVTHNRMEKRLWVYDGTGVSLLMDFGGGGQLGKPVVQDGVIFVPAMQPRKGGTYRGNVYYYANGTFGSIWESRESATTPPVIASFPDGIIIYDPSANLAYRDPLLFYSIKNGSIHGVGKPLAADYLTMVFSVPGDGVYIVGTANNIAYRSVASGSSYAPTGYLTTSLFDGDSSLTKVFRGIKVDWVDTGSGGSVDIQYKVNDLSNDAYTSLQTGAVSGTEYTLSGVTGRSISVRLVLNAGGSGTPRITRVYVRAAPLLSTFKRRQYVLSCTGKDGEGHPTLRDGTQHPKDGLAQATDLNTAATATSPFTITDRFGSFTGIVEPDGFELKEIRPDEFVALVKVREV